MTAPITAGEIPSLSHDEAMWLAAAEYDRLLALADDLHPDDWARTTDCTVPGEGQCTAGYLFDVIHTRDPLMHHIDICRATGRDAAVSAGHDGRSLADVVADWARRHGQPFTLTLTGPAGASFRAGDCGPDLELDAVEFARILSGREPASGLLATAVPF